MKVVALSDLHGILPHMEGYADCELCIVAGDVTPTSDHNLFFQYNWLLTKFRSWLERVPTKHLVWIAGNHDLVIEKTNVASLLDCDHIHYLQDNYVTIGGHFIYGTPYVPSYGPWAFGMSEEDLARKFSFVPEETQILVTHGPPRGLLDLVPRRTITEENETSWPEKEHAGSISLAKRVNQLRTNRLKLHCFGHLHSGYGCYAHTDIPGTICRSANVSILNDGYQHVNQPMVFDL